MAAAIRDRASGKWRTPFMSYATDAVVAEKRGDFQKAAEIWCKALVHSRNAVNREWAGVRIEFCSNAVHRGWGVPDESEAV